MVVVNVTFLHRFSIDEKNMSYLSEFRQYDKTGDERRKSDIRVAELNSY